MQKMVVKKEQSCLWGSDTDCILDIKKFWDNIQHRKCKDKSLEVNPVWGRNRRNMAIHQRLKESLALFEKMYDKKKIEHCEIWIEILIEIFTKEQSIASFTVSVKVAVY